MSEPGEVYLYENNKLIGKSKVTNGNATITITKPSSDNTHTKQYTIQQVINHQQTQ